MTISEMNEKRAQLMAEAQNAINDSDVETANAKMAEVSALDAQLDSVVTATKNLEALAQVKPAEEFKSVSVKTVAENSVVFESVSMDKETKYENAWAKWAMGTADAEDREVLKAYNAALTTSTTGAVIPTTIAKGILDDIATSYPFYASTAKTFVTGAVTILKDTASSAAAWYDEATSTADGSETIGTITLKGCELARSITLSWKLKAMSVSDFVSYVRAQVVNRMGEALGYGVINGRGVCPAGTAAQSAWKDEPLGIVTALKAETSTPQVVALTSPTDAQVTAAFATALSKVGSKYENGSAWYINSKTLYGTVAAILDTTGRPVFTVGSEISGGVVGYIFGKPVKVDSAMTDGEILIGNASKGYAVNINKNITVDTEEHVKARTTDYAAYAIVDGAPTANTAFALITIS